MPLSLAMPQVGLCMTGVGGTWEKSIVLGGAVARKAQSAGEQHDLVEAV